MEESEIAAAVITEEVKKEEQPQKVIAEAAKKSVSQTPKALNEEEFARSIMESLRQQWQEQQ